ncbi:MAG: hypothetical protein Q8P90_03750 [bacterium]|nr:hypothetical protein [bacterium]
MDIQLQAFLRNVLRSAHSAELPEPLEDKMIQDMMIQLESRIQAKILEVLPEVEHVEYLSMMQREAPQEEITEFIQKLIPDIKNLLATVFKDFEQEYINFIQKA